MLSDFSHWLSEQVANPWLLLGGGYLIMGVLVIGFIEYRARDLNLSRLRSSPLHSG